MTDDAFAALEARLAPVLAEDGRGHVDRHDVLALLAECRALRRPPDVDGLMPAAELDRLRQNVQEGALYRDEGRALVAHADALSALVRELYGVVADLHADDPGRQALLDRGRAEALEAVASACEAPLRLKEKSPPDLRGIPYAELHKLAAWVRSLGPCRPPLPPHAAEAEAGRLRGALVALASEALGCLYVLDDAKAPGHAAVLRGALADAREALAGDAP